MRMTFMFYWRRLHDVGLWYWDKRCADGATLEEAFHQAKDLYGWTPDRYEFLYFTHPERKNE